MSASSNAGHERTPKKRRDAVGRSPNYGVVSHVGGPPDVFAHSGGPNGAVSFNQVVGPGGTPFTSALGCPVTSAPDCVPEVASTACWFACDGSVTPRATDATSARLIARAIAAMPRTFVMRVVNSVSVAAARMSLIYYGTLVKEIMEGALVGPARARIAKAIMCLI